MGVCGSATFDKLKDSSARFDVEPSDTESLKAVTLPTLAFYVLLSDIKIKKTSCVSLELLRSTSGFVSKLKECMWRSARRRKWTSSRRRM